MPYYNFLVGFNCVSTNVEVVYGKKCEGEATIFGQNREPFTM